MDSTHWQTAVTRAATLTTSAGHLPATWDERAVRGVLAVAIAGIVQRKDRSVDQVGADELLELLDQGPQAVYESGRRLGLDTEDAPEDARAEWVWLTRPWPTEPPTANGGGLPSGIGRHSPLPAIDVCTAWAARTAHGTLTAEGAAGS
ncbi:hypothetical protein ABZX95_42300 [Streptomyces sp. NPDC004232]|uniref:hypothetical protein n=1 Tax=Streptomyces sp. NPDC004232 TaxID=3154454 RepID=UPI0033B35CB1